MDEFVADPVVLAVIDLARHGSQRVDPVHTLVGARPAPAFLPPGAGMGLQPLQNSSGTAQNRVAQRLLVAGSRPDRQGLHQSENLAD